MNNRLGRVILCIVGALFLANDATAATEQWTATTKTVKGHDITIYSKPTDDTGIGRIVPGSGQSLWFGELAKSTVVRFTLDSMARTFVVPISGASVHALAAGNRGRVWFADFNSTNIGYASRKGRFQTFDTMTSGAFGSTEMLESHDGSHWFGTLGAGIGHVLSNGSTTFFNLQDNATYPTALTEGPDGEIWFAEWKGPNVGYIDSVGAVHEFNAGFGSNSNTFGIAYGADQRIWFCDPQNVRISAINTDGTGLTSYSTHLTGMPDTIVAGPDGNLYFGEFNGAIGMIATSGEITEYRLPITEFSFPVLGMTVGPDGQIWFSNLNHAQIGQFKIQ